MEDPKEFPDEDEYGHKHTQAAIICDEHGRVYFTEEEYDQQMSRPNSLWSCPLHCGSAAFWDKEKYQNLCLLCSTDEFLDDA